MKRKILSLVMSAMLVISLVGCQSNQASNEGEASKELQKISFVLDWTPNTNHTGIYTALEKGYYKEAGLDVEIIQPPEDGALGALGSGNAQFGVDFQESLAVALTSENPIPVTAVAAIIDHNTSGIISLKEKGIDDFSKLEGKTYATWDMPSEKAILKQVMTDAGATYDKLNMVPNSGADALSLMQTDVDALWVYEGWDVMMAQLEGIEYNYLPFAEKSPVLDFYTPVIVANNEFLETNPESAKAFMQATAKGYEFAIENPSEAADILVKHVPELSKELVQKSQEFLSAQYKAEKTQWGIIDESRWSAFYDWMYDQKLIPEKLGNKGFTNEFLQ
ncbi:MAG: ABC transporter substrate-binding protein [Proteocatella sp.]